MALNIITAKFCSGATQTWTEEAWQYDYGQVLQFDGLDLPEAYQVHFSNVPMTGTTITQIGGADGVTVPDQYFTTGETIYAWVYLHEGEDDGETVYMVTIPVKKRPQPSDDVPTPVEQSAIDQAIAALNVAVEEAETAITHYPTIIDGTWHVWDVTEEEYVDTGVEAQGEQGQPGRDGTDGQDGQDGFSPVITVTDITGGHRVSITDANGTQIFNVMDGQNGTDGQDGYSPTVSVTEITGGHRVTITDAQGAHTFDVMDGEDAHAVDAGDVAYDATETYPADTVGDAITDVKADLSQFPPVKDSDATGVDFDVSDASGNVIVRLADGHIQTKNFDSEDITERVVALEEESPTPVTPELKSSSATGVDLDVSDESGNVLMRCANGHIRTSKFCSDDKEYKNTFAYNNTAGTQTITGAFAKGAKVVIGMQNMQTIHTNIFSNYKVTYSYTGKNGASHDIATAYPYDFIEYEFPEEAVSVTVTYPSTLYGAIQTTIAFLVYLVPSYGRKPIIVNVATDGSGDFTTIRGAVDSITDSNDYKTYEIHVHPGTYNVLEDYSTAEISEEGFQGLWINNGVSIIGVGGAREEIVIHGELDTQTYTSTKRNDISTLNVAGDIRIENVTIEAVNIRYGIHDDTASPSNKLSRREYINCKMVGTNLASEGNMQRSFGAGGGNRKIIYARDCDFSDCFAVHNSQNNTYSYHVILENCCARMLFVAEYANTVKAFFTFRNCKFAYILHTQVDSTASQAIFIDGEGTQGAVINCPSGFLYNIGDCHVFDGITVPVGKAVALTGKNEPGISATTSLDAVYGISLGYKNGSTYVQKSGYINSNILGLSNLSVGDYLTIDGSGNVVSGGTSSNAIAKVKTVTDGVGYAKILI